MRVATLLHDAGWEGGVGQSDGGPRAEPEHEEGPAHLRLDKEMDSSGYGGACQTGGARGILQMK